VEPGPVDEFDAVFRRYSPYVALIALRLLGREAEVDDVVQEVFLVAMTSLDRLRDPAAIRSWLATVTVRMSVRRLRMRRIRSFLGIEAVTDYGALAVDANQEQAALVARLYRVLDTLPAKDRVAWSLRRLEEEPLETVATICGCSLATAKRRVGAAQRAIEKAVQR
jgi:RNA polymerase sigma-70 factor (ECF subfamily)